MPVYEKIKVENVSREEIWKLPTPLKKKKKKGKEKQKTKKKKKNEKTNNSLKSYGREV